MKNLINRINKIERKVTPEPKKDILPILLVVWDRGGKTYYRDSIGEEKEYIESEHREIPILIKLAKGASPITNL